MYIVPLFYNLWYILGVGVDIKVDHAIVFGLAATPENLLQEGGRPKRGPVSGLSSSHGYAFFFHKGSLGNHHYILINQ